MTTNHPEVLESQAGSYVLPNPPRAGSALVVAGQSTAAGAVHRCTGETARRLGEHIGLLAECQQQFLAELRSGLQALENAVVEDARIRLQASVRSTLTVLDWCDSVQQELLLDCHRAARGLQPIDLVLACRDAVAEFPAHGVDVLVSGSATQPWWGDAARLAAALRTGLTVVQERIGGSGRIRVEVAGDLTASRIRIAGDGEPGDDLESATVRQFRNAVDLLGARVLPDALGVGGAGLVIELPPAAG